MNRLLNIGLFICTASIALSARSQTVFSVMKGQQKQADQYFDDRLYFQAIPLYENLLDKNSEERNILRLAQSFYFTLQYEAAISNYELYSTIKKDRLPAQDLYQYAEAQSMVKNYEAAIHAYTQLLEKHPQDELIARKIWRLNNIHYLYEDSSNYLIRPLAINSKYSEMSPIRFHSKLLFASNRKSSQLIEHIDQNSTLPFYQLYVSVVKPDTVDTGEFIYGEPAPFKKAFKVRYNIGPVVFFQSEKAMVFVASSEGTTKDGHRPLGLYFATFTDGEWRWANPFAHNSDSYSIFDVTINEAGTQLYFSSDMRGGFGGKDIYTSNFENGKWSKPTNMGEVINTPKDEAFPFIHPSGKFFFSSNGHPGIGGLDIFKVTALTKDAEVENMGYPINSSYDDFGLSLDSTETKGYLASNRRGKGFDDDIYEFDIDLQIYPFTITGIIQVKAHALSDDAEIQPWSDKPVALVDSKTGMKVFQGTTDSLGNFTIEIPYHSKYFIQIIDEAGIPQNASLELQKKNNSTSEYEIVMVRDIFNKQD